MAGFGIAFAVGGLYVMAKIMHQRRIFRGFSGKTLRPVAVEVIACPKNLATYSYEANGKKHKLSTYLFSNKPFYLKNDDTTMALGVVDNHGDYVFLIDEKLMRLDFTDAEREALRNARETRQSQSASLSVANVGIEPAR